MNSLAYTFFNETVFSFVEICQSNISKRDNCLKSLTENIQKAITFRTVDGSDLKSDMQISL